MSEVIFVIKKWTESFKITVFNRIEIAKGLKSVNTQSSSMLWDI